MVVVAGDSDAVHAPGSGRTPTGSPCREKPWTGWTVTRVATAPPGAAPIAQRDGTSVKSGARSSQLSAAGTSSRPCPKSRSGPAAPRSVRARLDRRGLALGRGAGEPAEQERQCTAHVRRGDRGSALRRGQAEEIGRRDVDPGRDDLRVDGLTARGGPAPTAGGERAGVVHGTDGEGARVVRGARVVTVVAGGEDGQHPGRPQVAQVLLERRGRSPSRRCPTTRSRPAAHRASADRRRGRAPTAAPRGSAPSSSARDRRRPWRRSSGPRARLPAASRRHPTRP